MSSSNYVAEEDLPKESAKELDLERLNDAIHEYNEGRNIGEYEIPSEDSLHKIGFDVDHFDYDEALEILGFDRVRRFQDGGKWNGENYVERLVDELLELHAKKGTHLLNSQNFEYLPELIEVSESKTQNSVQAETKQEGRFYASLDETPLIDSWGEGTRYIVKGEISDFIEVARELSKRLDTEKVMPRGADYVNLLNRASGGEGKVLLQRKTSAHPETPHARNYHRVLGSYNNAARMAGLEPNYLLKPSDTVEEAILESYHRLGRRPDKDELRELTGIDPEIFEDRHEGGLEGLMDELKIPTFEEELNNAFDTLVETLDEQ